MFLNYKNRKSEDEIMKLVNSYEDLEINNDNTSLLFKGENFKILSQILYKYKSKVDLIYIDPPYNTNRIFTVSKERSNTISNDENGEVAYSDVKTQEEYFEFIRERLILLRELLSDEGSIYLHIDYKIGHYIKILMDEIFGVENFKNDISRIKSNPKNFGRKAFGNQKDMILFYVKNKDNNIFNNITEPLNDSEIKSRFKKVESDGRRYTTVPVHAPGVTKNGVTGEKWEGKYPPEGRHWRYAPEKLDKLNSQNLIEWSSTGNPRLKNYADEHKGKKIQDTWVYKDPGNPRYPTEKNFDMLKLIIEQSSNPDSIVLDCYAGSGTTLDAAESLGRSWIGIDQSDVAIRAMKERFKNYSYKYIEITGDAVIKENILRVTDEQLELI